VRVGYGGPFHNVLVREITVGKDYLIYLVLVDQFSKVVFGQYRDAVRVKPAGQLGGVFLVIDSRNLGRREGYDFELFVVAVICVEVVEVSSGSSKYQNTFLFQFLHLRISSVIYKILAVHKDSFQKGPTTQQKQ
jgi:hypothetical protein